MYRLLTITTLILLFSLLFSLPQSIAQQYSYGLNGRYSYLYLHSADFDKDQLKGIYPSGVELTFHKKTNGEKAWQTHWKYPEIGFSLHFVQLDRSAILGHAIGATAYLQKKIVGGKIHQLSFKVGPGVVYNSKVYDAETNPLNLFVSTHINSVMEGNLLYRIRVADDWQINFAGVITHYSNGAINLPNRGYNMIGIQLGITYTPKAADFKTILNTDDTYEKKWNLDVMLAASLKSPSDVNNNKYFASTLAVYGNKRVARKSGLTVGLDFMYSEATKIIAKNENANRYRIGLEGGHELYISKFSFLSQIGYYVFRPEKIEAPIYLRWGLKYYVLKNLFANLTLKTHYGKADIIEWGIGKRF